MLSVNAATRAEQVREIKARAKAEGRALAPIKTSYLARIPDPPRESRKDISKTFELKRDAERWLAAKSAEIDRGDFYDSRRGDTLFRVVAEEWQETWAELAPKSRVGYESILACHVLPAFGTSRVAAITPKDVQDFSNGLARRLAPNTVRRVMDVVRGVFCVAVERRYITTSPAAAVRLPKKGEARTIDIQPLTHPEVRALVAALPEHWRLPVLLDAYTGLRAGELWALRRRDVHALRGEIAVDEAIKEVTRRAAESIPASQRLTDSLIVGPTKKYASRKVAVPAFLRDELAAHLSRPLPGGDGPEAFIFSTPSGEPVRHNLFYKRVFRPAVVGAQGAAGPARPDRQRLTAHPRPANRRGGTSRAPTKTQIPRPPPHVRGVADSGRSAPATDQAPPRPQGDPHDDGHLRPPVPERRSRAGRPPRHRLPRGRAAGRRRDRAGVRAALQHTLARLGGRPDAEKPAQHNPEPGRPTATRLPDGGHGNLPVGGRRKSPPAAGGSPCWWPSDLPTVLS